MSHFAPQPGMTIDRELDVDTFPARLEQRGSRILGGLAMFFGASFSLLPVAGLLMAVAEEGWTGEVLVGLAMFAVPFGLFAALLVWGYDQWVQRSIVSLDGQSARYEWRTWRGSRGHTEPLTNFRGIRALHRSDSDDGDSYQLLLEHPDPALSVLLYKASRVSGRAERWRRYCQVFGVSASEALAPGETIARPLDDLDRSLLELLRDDRVRLPDPGPAPQGVTVVPAADGFELSVNGRFACSLGSAGIRTPGRRGLTLPLASADSVTIGEAPGFRTRHCLRLGFHLAVEGGLSRPPLNLEVPLIEHAPMTTLVWAQRFLLRALARA